MLLIQNKHSLSSMNQAQDTGLGQEGYLERLLQGQHQQYQRKGPQQLSGNRNANENINNSIGINNNIASITSISNAANESSAISLPNSMGIGMNHHQHQQLQHQQQNRMMNFLQERQQQQQHLMAGTIINSSPDLSSNVGIAGLASNVGLDSRLGGNGIGSSISPNTWMDGLNRSGLGTGTTTNNSASLYPTEQDFLINSQRYPLVGNIMGTNRLTMNGEGNGSITGNPLASLLRELPQFCVPQNRASPQDSLNVQQKTNPKSFTDLFLAKHAQAALLQAAQARLPRTMRLPCGARGMKADHNSSVSILQQE